MLHGALHGGIGRRAWTVLAVLDGAAWPSMALPGSIRRLWLRLRLPLYGFKK
jgi:hypothetical protein